MDYGEMKNLKNKLTNFDLESSNFSRNRKLVFLDNPIEKYNFFVAQYNISYNLVDNKKMKHIPLEKMYRIGFHLQSAFIYFIIVYSLVPCILFLFQYFIYENHLFYLCFLSVYMGFLFIICFLTLLSYIIAINTFQKNLKEINNPFKNMIYHPDLCRLLNVNNEHVEYLIVELNQLNLTESQKTMVLQKPNSEGKVKFMIYDQEFIEYYSEIKHAKPLLIKHIIWLITSIGLYLIYYFYILYR